MPEPQRRLILANGEAYAEPFKKGTAGGSPEPPRSYDEARQLVKDGIERSLADFEALSRHKKVPDEAVFCLRLHPDATAKSYDPQTIFDEVPELQKIGSRSYHAPTDSVAQTDRTRKKREKAIDELPGRLLFVRSSPSGFQRLMRQLDQPASRTSKGFQTEIRRIERFDTLAKAEQIDGFPKEWRDGRIELVLHPSRLPGDRQLRFVFELLDECGIDRTKSRIRQYSRGPTFISCRATRQSLAALAGTNPLRAVHPLAFGGLEDLRGVATFPAPRPPASITRSTIKVGMFDGGVDVTVPHLNAHVEEDTALAIKTSPDAVGIAHGTAVAGALLYGELNGIAPGLRLPSPPVSVVSIRALPTSDPSDLDLYESIDVIEAAVPQRPDIKTFNVSFGPRGPFVDDPISRFTFVLDTLSVSHKVSFFVAVGNDGEAGDLGRIQSPSDSVHCIGVGAFTWKKEEVVHAPYSCFGPGRECGKIKPDLVAFGGCENHPIHLISTKPGLKLLSAGTSFANPIAARVGAQAVESFDRGTALLARALLIHTAQHPDKSPDHLLGHGCVLTNIDDVLYCPDHAVTVVFQGALHPGSSDRRMVKLPIPWPSDLELPGKVSWTIGALSKVDALHSTEYTSCCIEETFYPHSRVFSFVNPNDGKTLTRQIDVFAEPDTARQLIAEGWKKGGIQVSQSGNQYKDESERRADCKWEPIVRRSKRRTIPLFEPSLVLHGISRNGESEPFDYVAVVTIEIPKFVGDLYTEICRRYSALVPIRLRTEAEVRVPIR